jgi:hypothetical protein
MAIWQATMFKDLPKHQNLPTKFSGCLSEARSLGVWVSLQKAATGFRSPVKLQTHSVHHPKAGVFLCLCYGGCAREIFGSAGFLKSRSANLRTAATLCSFRSER